MKIIYGFLCFILINSCSVDYDPDSSNIVEKDRLVVNSILNPVNPIDIWFYTSFKTDQSYSYKGISNVQVVLKENDQTLYSGICTDTLLHLNYYPKIGANYSIEVSLPGYETISAGTSVPDSITCTARMDFDDFDSGNKGGDIASLSYFKIPKGDISMWVTAYIFYKNKQVIQYNELFANNMLLDKINRIEGSMVMNELVGSSYHDAFLRIKNTYLQDLDSVIYTPTAAHYWGEDYPDYKLQETDVIKIITASKEYDQYNRTLYQQKSMIIYDDDISTIVYQPIQVYSNVKNGLGIFAGMSETNYYFEIPLYIIE